MCVCVCVFMCLGDWVYASMCACRCMYAWRPDFDIGISLDGCLLYSLDHGLSLESEITHMACLANQLGGDVLSVGVIGRLPCSSGICVGSWDHSSGPQTCFMKWTYFNH